MVLLWLPARAWLGSDAGERQFLDYYVTGELNLWRPIYFLAFQNLWWSVINLLPIRPLDGGNVTAELFGIDIARRISVGVAIAGAVCAFFNDQGYAGFFALFLAFNNYQEIRAERAGRERRRVPGRVPGSRRGRPRSRRRRGRANLSVVAPAPLGAHHGHAGPGAGRAPRVGGAAGR